MSPTPGVDQALLRITASGVCHSDLHLARGDWYGMQPPSLGHEAIGIVEDLGPGADRFVKVGDRVIVGLGGSGGGFWCGACEFCLRGQPRLCAQTQNVMGTFAEQFVVYAPGLVTLPDSIPRHRGAARLRRPHRVRRGEEGAEARRAAGTTRRRHRRGRRPRPLRRAAR